MGPNGTYLTVL